MVNMNLPWQPRPKPNISGLAHLNLTQNIRSEMHDFQPVFSVLHKHLIEIQTKLRLPFGNFEEATANMLPGMSAHRVNY